MTDSKFTNSNGSSDLDFDLDSLFAQARSSEPDLMDDNFTKIVLNSLPKRLVAHTGESLRKGLSFDVVGACLGLLLAYLFIDQGSLMSALIGLIPESLVLSPLHFIGLGAGFVAATAAAWWASEQVAL